MNSLPQQRDYWNPPVPRVFEVDGEGTATVMGAETDARHRRGYYVAHADVALCFRGRNHDEAEQEARCWLDHLDGDSCDILIRTAFNGDVDVARASRPRAAELFGEGAALLEPPKPKRCECGAPRGYGRRLSDSCRLARLRETGCAPLGDA